MPNIILEGFDGTGKSYLSKFLSENLDMEIYWPGGPPRSFVDMLKELLVQLTSTNTIFDRVTCISEACYRENMTDEVDNLLRMCREEMVKQDNIFIFCDKIIGEDSSGFQDKDHQASVALRQSSITTKYTGIFSDIEHIKYRAKETNMGDLLNDIRRRL